jgi:hypothetical protein
MHEEVLHLKVGDWVDVRSKDEILATLDQNGQLDRLPFMPQMFTFCGKRFRVYKTAHKTCDTVNKTGGRTMTNAVHLEGLRCDGSAHGGCQASCLIFWKEAWLKRAEGTSSALGAPLSPARCTESDVQAGTQTRETRGSENPVYVCQVTQIPVATQRLPWWDVRQFWKDYTRGNVGLGRLFCGLTYATYNFFINLGIGIGPALQWLYDRFQSLRGGVPYPRKNGLLRDGQLTPSVQLNLQPGELVKVKSYNEILKTLTHDSKNRGLFFDAEMVPFCGGTYRVLKRVNRIINEQTGKMMHFKNECIILEDVFCQSRYSCARYFCPRSIYSYWREIWLERVYEPKQVDSSSGHDLETRRSLSPDLELSSRGQAR